MVTALTHFLTKKCRRFEKNVGVLKKKCYSRHFRIFHYSVTHLIWNKGRDISTLESLSFISLATSQQAGILEVQEVQRLAEDLKAVVQNQ